MRILIVAMSNSVHTARWIGQIKEYGYDIHLFPSIDVGLVHPDIAGVTVYHSIFGQRPRQKSLNVRGFYVGSNFLAHRLRKIICNLEPDYRRRALARLIEHLKPDLIHSMETQAAGYLVSEVAKHYNNSLPLWIHTLWGSDLAFFAGQKEHRSHIRQTLKHCNFLATEGERDSALARQLGFRGAVMLESPATAGFDIQWCTKWRKKLPERKIIMLKGYHGWTGRALVGLEALRRCASRLKGYTVVLYSADKNVALAALRLSKRTGVTVRIIPVGTDHAEMLKLHGLARISLGLGMSDGVPNSMLEALTMGSYPIQSNTAITKDWINPGKTGAVVPPENIEIITTALKQALDDDTLVQKAAKTNVALAKDKLDYRILQLRAISLYQSCLEAGR